MGLTVAQSGGNGNSANRKARTLRRAALIGGASALALTMVAVVAAMVGMSVLAAQEGLGPMGRMARMERLESIMGLPRVPAAAAAVPAAAMAAPVAQGVMQIISPGLGQQAALAGRAPVATGKQVMQQTSTTGQAAAAAAKAAMAWFSVPIPACSFRQIPRSTAVREEMAAMLVFPTLAMEVPAESASI